MTWLLRLRRALLLLAYGVGLVFSMICTLPTLPGVFVAKAADDRRQNTKPPSAWALLTMVFWILAPVVGIGALFSAAFEHFAWRIQAVLDAANEGNDGSGGRGLAG